MKENDCSYSWKSYTWQCNTSTTKSEVEDVSLETNLGLPLHALPMPAEMDCEAVLMYKVDGEEGEETEFAAVSRLSDQ